MTVPAPAADVRAEAVADGLVTTARSLARRFAAGATMWCVAPRWPSHGRHVAVEFVHPVIVGKRALPAVDVDVADPTGALRLLARPGDVLLVVGPTDEPTVDLLRRAEAWGLSRIWLGAGIRPPTGSAEHVVWWGDVDPDRAARSGDVVLLYHLLWELTHVVFEHPGLLDAGSDGPGEVCVTCADEAEVAEVRAIDDLGRADVVVVGRLDAVDVSLVGSVAPGDLLLVHAGVALSVLGNGGSA